MIDLSDWYAPGTCFAPGWCTKRTPADCDRRDNNNDDDNNNNNNSCTLSKFYYNNNNNNNNNSIEIIEILLHTLDVPIGKWTAI